MNNRDGLALLCFGLVGALVGGLLGDRGAFLLPAGIAGAIAGAVVLLWNLQRDGR